MKALVIEDDENTAKLYQQWLERLGFKVVIIDQIEAGLQFIRETPNLEFITLDLNLKDSRGLATVARIQEIRKVNPTAYLVVISGVLTPIDTEKAIIYGADGTIEKIEVVTEKSFWRKIADIFTSVKDHRKNELILEALTAKLITPPPSEPAA